VTVAALLWWSDRDLARIASRFEHAAAQWSDAWGIDARPAVEYRRAHEWSATLDVPRIWWPLANGADDERRAWVRTEPHVEEQVFAALFGPRAPRAWESDAPLIADRLARLAWSDLQASLRSACLLPEGPDEAPSCDPPRFRACPWSGALVAAIRWAGLEVVIQASASVAGAMMASIASPAPANSRTRADLPAVSFLDEALSRRSVRVRVGLASAELDLGSLQSLAVGDVIRLPHPLTLALAVRAEGDEAILCHAYLGRLEGRRAIELAKAIP
jgi:hypothetical protein